MSHVQVQLAIDRLKVELSKPVVVPEGTDGGGASEEGITRDDMRHRLVALQMKLRDLRDEEELVGVV